MTVRVISSNGDKLTNNDLTHVGQYHMKACYHNFGTDTDKWDEVAADRVSLVTPYTFAKFKLKTTKGIEFWKELIPQIPTKTDVETTGAYRILLPGETMFEELFFSVAFAQLALGHEDDLKMIETAIRVGNPLLRNVTFRLKATGLDPTSKKTGVVMELLSADRERCFGPKPADPTTSPKWKLKINFSTVNVTIAYGKSEKRRQEKAEAMKVALSKPPPPPPPPKEVTATVTTTDTTTTTAATTPATIPATTPATETLAVMPEMTEEELTGIMLDDTDDEVMEIEKNKDDIMDKADEILDDDTHKDAT